MTITIYTMLTMDSIVSKAYREENNMPEIQNCDEIEKLRGELEKKITAKMIALIDEAEKRGMTKFRGYASKVNFRGKDIEVCAKNDTSRNGKTYFKAGEIYYISAFEGKESSASQLLDAVEILKLVIEKFNAGADKDKEKMALAEKMLTEMKI